MNTPTLTGTYTCTHHNDQQRTECPVCLVPALTAEVKRLRSDRDCEKRLRKDADEFREDAIARAMKAEVKLADQAARFHDEIVSRQGTVRANQKLDLQERDQLLAEVERLKRDYEYDHKCLHEVRERCESWKQRAQRAEAERTDAIYQRACEVEQELRADLAIEREKSERYRLASLKLDAQLADWSVLNLWGGTPEIIHEFIKGQQNRIYHCQDLEAELDKERAIVSQIWVQLKSPTYAQLDGRSIYDLIDEIKADLATERARLDSGQILLTVAGDRVWHCGVDLRAAIDAGMREGAK